MVNYKYRIKQAFVIGIVASTLLIGLEIRRYIILHNVILYKELPANITSFIESIRRDCGELCETVALGEPGPYFDSIKFPINCPALFRNEYIDHGHGLRKAPDKIPIQLYDDFTMNQRLEVTRYYFDEVYLGKTALLPVWAEELIDQFIASARNNNLKGNYGIAETNALRDGLKKAPGIRNGRVLVIGSENPWVEACVLEAGAQEIVTLEYGKIISKHPKVKTMTPDQFRYSYLHQTLGTFDAVVTFSSVEHSGLGRYGDALNPWGDIIAIARAWCVTKEGGSLTIGVMYDDGDGYIRFNGGRWYGKVRYPYLTTNWHQLYRGNGSQRVHVFTKENINYDKPVNYHLKQPFPYHSVSKVGKRYSQAGQDELVYKLFPKKHGFFIDIGANDGKLYSNTLWLERKYDWTGLLIEASPDLCRKIDQLQRHAWRLCACISETFTSTKFVQSETVGGMASEIDKHHSKLIKNVRTITVPCFNMNEVLKEINIQHIDYFSLDVEGAELVILNSMKSELLSRKMIVDVWTIEFRVYDGKRNRDKESFENLEKLRSFFREIGGYFEHSQINFQNSGNNGYDGLGLDVVFVYIESWCKVYSKLPNGKQCLK